MSDTKPDIPQETVAKAAEAAWLALQTGGCTAEKIALAVLKAAGVGELIAEKDMFRDLPLDDKPYTDPHYRSGHRDGQMEMREKAVRLHTKDTQAKDQRIADLEAKVKRLESDLNERLKTGERRNELGAGLSNLGRSNRVVGNLDQHQSSPSLVMAGVVEEATGQLEHENAHLRDRCERAEKALADADAILEALKLTLSGPAEAKWLPVVGNCRMAVFTEDDYWRLVDARKRFAEARASLSPGQPEGEKA